MRFTHAFTVIVLASTFIAAAPPATPAVAPSVAAVALPPTKDSYVKIHAEVEKSLIEDDLKKFFPAAMDETNGGFYQVFGENWTRGGRGGGGGARGGFPGRGGGADTARSIVYQSRLTWLAAQAAMRYPAQKDEYLKYARLGATFLMEKQWDKANGGWWWEVNAMTAQPTRVDDKHMYGQGFAVYALAAYYQASKDPAALDAAKKGFAWFEEHAHDAANGGYYEQMKGDGTRNTGAANDVIGTRGGLKSMNTHIHLLEAFTGLLEVWPDEQLKKRTEELYQINLTKIYYEPGALHMFFNQDWSPVGEEDSYGHDIESAFLYAEAAKALGKPEDPVCWKAGKAIVDHCLKIGFNQKEGFLYNAGTLEAPRPGNLEWWTEAESLNALLLMHEKYGKNDPQYWNAFVKQWNFIYTRFIDHTNGGWFKGVNAGGSNPTYAPTRGPKTDAWTEGYHQGRAMMNVTEALTRLAGESK